MPPLDDAARIPPLIRTFALALACALAACDGELSRLGGARSGDAGPSGDAAVKAAEIGASTDGRPATATGMATDGRAPVDLVLSGPDTSASDPPVAAGCGFDRPAFCDTFEAGPAQGGRSGELDPARWSVMRGAPYNSSQLDDAIRVGPALIGACRAGLSNARVLPDSDVVVCDPIPTIASRHVLATAAAQNYGLATYRIRQPFDFAGRTGAIKLDMELSNHNLGGWPALIVAEDPTPAPSFDWEERGSGPRNGFSIEFLSGCSTPRTVQVIVYAFNDYVQKRHLPPTGCQSPHALTAPGAVNRLEVRLSQRHLEVWVSDASADGTTFSPPKMLFAGDLALPFSRGYVSLALRNHATIKYWLGSAATVRWDNIGFDGPAVTGWREYSVPDSLAPYRGLPGCKPSGGACQWTGDVIPAVPGEAGRTSCAATACTHDGEGRNVGYVVPNVEEPHPPVALRLTGVTKAGATRARLALAGSYPWFEWNGKLPPPTQLNLRHRLNGGPWHDRHITPIEANAFADYFPETGAGKGAGLLNQVITLPLDELREGDNLVELQAAGTWTGAYRLLVTGVDLVLDDRP